MSAAMSGTKVKQGTEGRDNLKRLQDSFVVVCLWKHRIPHPCTHWASVPLSHIYTLSFFDFFYIETGSHKIVQAGLNLTLQPSQTELAGILPQSPFVSSYSHRPSLEGAAGCEGLCKGEIYWRVCVWDKSALERHLCSLLICLLTNSDCHITGVQ